MINLFIDGKEVEVPEGSTVLQAAEKAGKKIPTLCFLKDINEIGACRVCLVEVEGARNLLASCVTPVSEGMKVLTNTPRVRRARKLQVELLLSNHEMNCPTCIRNGNCELKQVAEELGIREIRFNDGKKTTYSKDNSTPALIRDPGKCILCRRCVSVCSNVQTVEAIVPIGRGFDTVIAPSGLKNLADSPCVKCGQCVLVCPTGALTEKEYIEEVWAALDDPKKHVVVQTAPATRVAIGQEFGYEPGSINTGQMVAALRALGFDRVFDTDFTADLTIMEEGTELLHRLKNGGKLPMITSCSPGWINFIETFYGDYIDHLSTCKSPQQMFGALTKTYYAEKFNIDPADIVCVSIMPCTAKKFEARRPEMISSGYPDVDYVLTTRELARMIKQAGIKFDELEEEEYDEPLGISTGAGLIFGATGGVMEAALRTVYEIVTKKELENLEFEFARGLEDVKETEIDLDGTKVRVAVAHGLKNARKLLDQIKNGESPYHFIEIMCCPGGCIGGGGQPIPTNTEIRQKRIEAIYKEDKNMPLRKSHENPVVQVLYKDFLGEPLSEKSHQLLHTHYTKRSRYKI
ncbi:ferredoxin [Anoxybacter fermentans]|uniref:Ferredoxin n=1 Tax=Anoxybacter fermentans TaxID=1323375 RepID=A0A3Q9HSS8_9FIRM|nr:NADH-dependent [FeFe] hydrogenase, group A6 [Anoxybacter fermentans]AZR74823.1 ferredoxin [Anoxybacter fermentans]